jgi:integrase
MARACRVSWHKTGRWRFTRTGPDGKRKEYYASPEIPQTEVGRRKATEWMEAKLRELSDRVVTGDDFTLEDLRLAYLTWVKRRVAADEAAQHTLDGHRKQLNLICATPRGGTTYGHLLARELTTKVAAELVRRWTQEGRGPTTIRNRIGSLQAMLNWASRPRADRSIERLIPANPIAGFELPRAGYQGDRYAPAAEVEAFLAWLDQQAAARVAEKRKGVSPKHARFARLTAQLVRFVAETGCRPGEACRLEWRHVDLAGRMVVFPPKEHKTGRKTKRPRTLAISTSLKAMLESVKAEEGRHPTFVFTHPCGPRSGAERTEAELTAGEPWNSNALSRRIKELRRAAIAAGVLSEDTGLKRMHLYRLRHTRITDDLQGGMAATNAAALNGNSVKMIESVYLHAQPDHLLDVADRVRGGK